MGIYLKGRHGDLGADVVNHGTLWLCQNSDIEAMAQSK